MNFKKRVNGSWTDTSHYIHNTSTDTITTLPVVLYPNDTTATVGLKGQAVQSSVPSPTSPVMPQGTGERTANLINVPTLSDVRWATRCPDLLDAINSLPNGVYTMLISYELTSRNDTTDSSVCGWHIANNSSVLSNIRLSWGTVQIGDVLTVVDTFTIDDNNRGSFTALYLYGCGINGVGATGSANAKNIMLNIGSTALPYELYGYKIPISSANTTTPVYLGEVQTTRKIKKLVLDGTEGTWKKSSTYQGSFYNQLLDTPSLGIPILCSHAVYTPQITASTYVYGKCGIDGGANVKNLNLFIGEASWSVSDFQQYLTDQYAAGTPVTIWYVLAEPTTGIVNEPIRKIGDYTDEVSGITIPVIAGGDTLSVDTTLQPSEVTVNYKGWHPVQSVHERENGAWI